MNYQRAESWMIREIAAINRVLQAHSTGAATHPSGAWALVARSSHVSYQIKLKSGKKISGVESIGAELNEAVSNVRKKATKIRFGYMPFAIEVPYPHKRPLHLVNTNIDIEPHSMLVGRSYSHTHKTKDEVASLNELPHVLIVGETGAGKSILQSVMLLSLCMNTSPDELQLVLIDLKNEDLVPFSRLPHVRVFAGKIEDAMSAINHVYNEMINRIDHPNSSGNYRLVMAIDELARLAHEPDAKKLMGEIQGVGRSKRVNMIGATQHPTKDGGLGAMMKANFPLRLVGMVTPGLSHIATGQAKAGADLLPGAGAFLWCKNKDVRRFQSYMVTEREIESMIDQVINKWSGSGVVQAGLNRFKGGSGMVQKSVQTGYEPVNHLHTSNSSRVDVRGNTPTGSEFPVTEKRELTESEQNELIRMAKAGKFDYSGSVSFSQACKFAYGCKEPFRFEHIKQVLGAI